MDETIRKILKKNEGKDAKLLAILHDVQDEFGYIPDEAMKIIAEELRISKGEVYDTASFYSFFTFEPVKHVIRVCNGVVCHLKGIDGIIETIKSELGISEGETTPDGMFKLELTGCIGHCDAPPAMMIDDEVFTGLTPEKVVNILRRYRK